MPVDGCKDGASEEILQSPRPFFMEIVSPQNINMKEQAWSANKIMSKSQKKVFPFSGFAVNGMVPSNAFPNVAWSVTHDAVHVKSHLDKLNSTLILIYCIGINETCQTPSSFCLN